MPTPDATTPLPASSLVRPRRLPGLTDLPVLAVALLCTALGLALAAHHPLSPTWAVAAWLAAAALSARWWAYTPALLMGALPLIGLAPWTGWITFEEQDLLVLACAAGGYAAVALGKFSAMPPARLPTWRRVLSLSPLAGLLLAALGAALLVAMQRGFADAGGFQFGWFQGYHEPMNSLRLTKPFFLAALLLPLWMRAGRRQPRELAQALLWGMVLALAGTSLAAIVERMAFTGLLNFSTDYRSTALFWEMHVGGAALDGCMALTLPFAMLALLRAHTPWRFALLMGLAMLAAYAVLTTFSRGLYAAVPISLGLLLLLRDGQRRRAADLAAHAPHASVVVTRPGGAVARLGMLLLGGSFVGAAVLMFGGNGTIGGGYRGLLALLGATAVLLTMPASVWLPSPAQRVTGLLMGALLAAVLSGAGWALAMAVPKAAYAEYLLAFAAAGWLRWQDRPGVAQPVHACLVNAAWFWLLGSMVVVAGDWGGDSAMASALLAMLLLGLLWPLMLLWPALWPFSASSDRTAAAPGEVGWRSRSLLFGGLLLVAAVVASLGGGQYLRDRASSWQEDMKGRETHWQESLALLNSQQDWLFGKGAGRFVANHFFAGPVTQHTGDYRLKRDPNGQPHLVLTGGKHMLGYGELFRISQRIAAPEVSASGDVRLDVQARATSNTQLHAEICEKQLLYVQNCMSAVVTIKPQANGQWQSASLSLGKAQAMGGTWYAPRFVTFSVAVDSTGGVLDIANLQLRDGSGQQLLHNGDFSSDMARWFFSSDRHHMPWHIKNMGLHLLFDSGLLGLALVSTLLLLALLRLSFGRGRDHALAPALLASLVGFLVVGLFDSLLDVPRVAFMFYTVLLFSLGLRALPGGTETEPSK